MNFYDICKALGQIIFPAILTFIGVIGAELGWDCTELIMKIGAGFIAMWNSIIVVWNKEYYKNQLDEASQQEEGV